MNKSLGDVPAQTLQNSRPPLRVHGNGFASLPNLLQKLNNYQS